MSEELLREAEVVTEFLYGTRSRTAARNLLSGHFERQDENTDQRINNPNPYDVYFISSKQQSQPVKTNSSSSVQQQQQIRRPRTLQRGVTTPVTNPTTNYDYAISPETKMRCNSSICDFWPHCSQRDTIYSPNQVPLSMKVSHSYPAHQRMTTETGSQANCGSACSSPGSLERMNDRESRDRETSRKNRQRDLNGGSKYQERVPKGVLKHSRWSSHETTNGHVTNTDKRDYRMSEFDVPTKLERKVSPNQNKSISKSSSVVAISSSTTSSSSSSDIWVTTSDRTATKSPRNARSSGTSTPMEDGMAIFVTALIEPPRGGMLSRPGSAPAKRETSLPSDVILDPHQRSLSLPKSFLTHNSTER